MTKIKGSDLMLFVAGKSVAYATSHTLSVSADTTDTSNKDEGGGGWASSDINKLSWTSQTENLYSEDGNGESYKDLFALMIAKIPIELVFSLKTETATDVPEVGWTPKATGKYSGKALITSLELNAPNGENATFTAQFTGVGALALVAA